MKAIVLHSIHCHYEMIGSILEQFKEDYAIDIYFPHITHEIQSWIKLYTKCFGSVRIVRTVDKNYDLCILHTDDDLEMCKIYSNILYPCPVYIVNHIKTGCRSVIPRDKNPVWNINIHGIQPLGQPFHFCGYNYTTVEQKIKSIHAQTRTRTSVCVIGAISKEETNFLAEMQSRILNFPDIDVYIINRALPPWYVAGSLPPNVKLYISIDAEEMFELLSKSHYVYFFAYKRGIQTCSAAFGLAYTTLCKMVCCDRSESQYELTSPIFKTMTDKFTLEPLNEDDVREVYAERTLLIQKTNSSIKSLIRY